MGDQIQIYSKENIQVILLLHKVFKDVDKVFSWLHTENPHLGRVTPVEMMLRGRTKKLLQFIECCLEENHP